MAEEIKVNLRSAFNDVMERTKVVLFTRMGDKTLLQHQQHEVDIFMSQLEQHIHLFSAEECAVYADTYAHILQCLEQACHMAADPPDGTTLVASRRVRNGKPGRSKVQIPLKLLDEMLKHRDLKRLGALFGCSARTIRRRALDYGLRIPGKPVCEVVEMEDGTSTRIYTPTSRVYTSITDNELDCVVFALLQAHPNMGHRMLRGSLHASGYYVTHRRQRESYLRVHGPSGNFGDRRIHRRQYKVSGPNSLWHHDGQHGLIKYKIVFHCFVDGYSRMIVGLGVNTNNRARTVLDLFEQAIQESGIPSRVRGDHGTENLMVCAWMEAVRGRHRGSYLWGRSVHNTRIERLWYDLTRDFGQKWKNFFLDLEHTCGLDPNIPEHIWLLHFLFLNGIKQDAAEWMQNWNWHKLSLGRGNTSQSPREMWIVGMYQNGARGLENILQVDDTADAHELEEYDEEARYSIETDAHVDASLQNHLQVGSLDIDPDYNAGAASETDQLNSDANPFTPYSGPHRLSNVPCDSPDCPFTPDEVELLKLHISIRVGDIAARSMDARKKIWKEGLSVAADIHASRPISI